MMNSDCRSFWNNLFNIPDIPALSPVAQMIPAVQSYAPTTSERPMPKPDMSSSQPRPADTASLENAVAEANEAGENDVECTTGNCPDCEVITGEMLSNVYNQASADDRDAAAKELNWFINRGELDSELRLAHFLGQTRQETGGYILKSENLNYKVSVLKAKFGYYGKNPKMAEAHGRKDGQSANQQAIANHAYANRIGNGSITSGDGWRYRGRGIKQLTGRGNYQDFTTGHKELWLEDKNFETDPDIISSNPKYAVRSGIWFWVNHNLGLKADRGGTRAAADAISTVINRWDGDVGFTNRYNYMREILDAGTFANVCFNKSLLTRNEKSWHPFGNNGR